MILSLNKVASTIKNLAKISFVCFLFSAPHLQSLEDTTPLESPSFKHSHSHKHHSHSHKHHSHSHHDRVGPTGATGPTGPTGPTGLAAPGSIIPFASGLPVTLTTFPGTGLPALVAGLGFGANSTYTLSGSTINISAGPLNVAFSAPRAGTITSISAYFNTTAAATILGTATIEAQVYLSTGPNELFTAVGSPVVLSPSLSGVVAIGTIASGTLNGLSIPVAEGNLILLVFSVTTTGTELVDTVIGFASAGVTID